MKTVNEKLNQSLLKATIAKREAETKLILSKLPPSREMAEMQHTMDMAGQEIIRLNKLLGSERDQNAILRKKQFTLNAENYQLNRALNRLKTQQLIIFITAALFCATAIATMIKFNYFN